jgi:putative membrane protein
MPFFFVLAATVSVLKVAYVFFVRSGFMLKPFSLNNPQVVPHFALRLIRGPWPMKFVSTIVGLVLFILFFGFALKNTQTVDLHFFLNYELRGPLVLMLLAFFIAGAALGILAVTPTVFRQRRERTRAEDRIAALQNSAGGATIQPQPDSVIPRR